jgi:hypothetical protein
MKGETVTKLLNDSHGSGYLVSVFWLWPQVVYLLPCSLDVDGPRKPPEADGCAWFDEGR